MLDRDNLIDTFVEVQINSSDDFLKVRETLTRMGVANHKNKTLFQSCHILHKRGKYYIVHFKELFALDGRQATLSDEDLERRNSIAKLLEEWGMLKILTPQNAERILENGNGLSVISFRDKKGWDLRPKYSIGKPN